MIVISDNSVLSCLSEIGEVDLLRRLYGKVTITETIQREAVHPSAPEALRLLFLRNARLDLGGSGRVVLS